MRNIFILLILLSFLGGCREEKEVQTGDITGKIVVYNQDESPSSDNSGVQVNLFSDSTLLSSTITNSVGLYRFENIIYGKYRIELLKENYLGPAKGYSVFHIGGYSPTIMDGRVYETPDYTLTIDSIDLHASSNRLYLYLKINGDTLLPFLNYQLVAYCSTSQDPSMDNYSFMISGFVYRVLEYTPGGNGFMEQNIWQLNTPDTFYLRFYLLSYACDAQAQFNNKGLGKPSNVVSFKWQ
jgi:hypothetical protein